jgi:hypothetical protein
VRQFAALGYDGASIGTINRELGVSQNLTYQRRGTKEHLWRDAVDYEPRLAGLGIGALLAGIAFGVLAIVTAMGAVAIVLSPKTVHRSATPAIVALRSRVAVCQPARAEYRAAVLALIGIWMHDGLFMGLAPMIVRDAFSYCSGLVEWATAFVSPAMTAAGGTAARGGPPRAAGARRNDRRRRLRRDLSWPTCPSVYPASSPARSSPPGHLHHRLRLRRADGDGRAPRAGRG